MALNIYGTGSLVRVVDELVVGVSSWLLDSFFPTIQTSTDERIYFDVNNSKPRLAPFVAPHVAGKVVEERGFKTRSFVPAYVKDKRILRPSDVIKRRKGEALLGSLTPAQRRAVQLRENLEDQAQMLTMREEVMASENLRTGKITVSGEGYETQVIDFFRDPALTITLAGNHKWNVVHADSDPMDDLETWAALVQEKSGIPGTTVIMAPDAWRACRARLTQRDELEKLFDYARSGDSNTELGPLAFNYSQARRVGRLGDFDIWTYDGLYIDDTGTERHLMPSGTVIMTSGGVEGVRAYGMIHDEENDFQAERFFVKSWVEPDPSVRYLLLQSAPLPFTYRPNAALSATVL